MSPKEWKFVIELYENVARAAYHEGRDTAASPPHPDSHFKMSKASQLALKTALEKAIKT